MSPTNLSAIRAREMTAVHVDAARGHYAAMAFFAVLVYPGIDKISHARRDRLMEAVQDWISGWKKLQLGYRRVSARRATFACDTWIRRRQSMKNDAVFRMLNRAEKIIVERRLLAARIVEQLAGLWASEHFNQSQSRIRLKIAGPQSVTGAIAHLAEQTSSGDTSTLWRIWRESLPVLHLACAFHHVQPERQKEDRPDLILRCVRDHRLWVAATLQSAEVRASMLPHYTNFDPAKRVTLIAQ